jgi:hypothetical protein
MTSGNFPRDTKRKALSVTRQAFSPSTNQVEQDESIKVVIRCRPMNDKEIQDDH